MTGNTYACTNSSKFNSNLILGVFCNKFTSFVIDPIRAFSNSCSVAGGGGPDEDEAFALGSELVIDIGDMCCGCR